MFKRNMLVCFVVVVLMSSVMASGCNIGDGALPMCADITYFGKEKQSPYLSIAPGEARALLQDAPLEEFGGCWHLGVSMKSIITAVAFGDKYRQHDHISIIYSLQRGKWASKILPKTTELKQKKEATSSYEYLFSLDVADPNNSFFLLQYPWSGTTSAETKISANDLRALVTGHEGDVYFFSLFIRNEGAIPIDVYEYTVNVVYTYTTLYEQ